MINFTSLRLIVRLSDWRLAEAAIQAAFRLRPDAGEAHLARAETSLSRIPRL